MSYYRSTFIIVGVMLTLCIAGCLVSSLWFARRCDELSRIRAAARLAAVERLAAERDALAREEQTRPLKAFSVLWTPYLQPALPRDLGNHLRNELAQLATRTGLTSEGATVPAEPRRYSVGGGAIRVQQVSLNIISDSLPAVLAWLGAAESRFPYARVEQLALSGYASRSVQLSVTFLHPIHETGATGSLPVVPGERVTSLP